MCVCIPRAVTTPFQKGALIPLVWGSGCFTSMGYTVACPAPVRVADHAWMWTVFCRRHFRERERMAYLLVDESYARYDRRALARSILSAVLLPDVAGIVDRYL